MINIAIVEDDKSALDVLKGFLLKFEEANNLQFSITSFNNGLDLLDEYPSYDLLFMDIELPFINGMDVCRKVRKIDQKVNIVFVTNMANYAATGYEVDAVAFMVKPITYYNFENIVKKVLRNIDKADKNGIAIRTNNEIKKVLIDDLLYVEVSNHNLFYHTFEGTYSSRQSLSQVEENLSKHYFAKCNNCYLVNLKYVSNISGNDVELKDKSILQISRSKKKNFVDAFLTYIGENV